MKNAIQLKKPFGHAEFSRVKHARYLGWEDAFDVEFEDGLCFLEPHSNIRKSNHIAAAAIPVRVEVDEELGSHFRVTYGNGQVAEVSWAYIRELPPRIQAKHQATFGKNIQSVRQARQLYGIKIWNKAKHKTSPLAKHSDSAIMSNAKQLLT